MMKGVRKSKEKIGRDIRRPGYQDMRISEYQDIR
jgi:hypothetical protein